MQTVKETLTLWQMSCRNEIDKLISEDTIPLLTIGYQGYTTDKFVNRLKQFKVSFLADVREIPFSRKKGFSKSPLKNLMAENNIGYVHFKELGSPKEIRNRLRQDEDYDSFFEDYKYYLKSQQDTLSIITTAIEENPDKIFCLLCFESNPEICHRSVLAQKIAELMSHEVKIVNI